jgi:thiol-disulfide isomerase/thioredoxin
MSPKIKSIASGKKTLLKNKNNKKHVSTYSGLCKFWVSLKKPVMMFVYSNSCPHCITMKPEWDKYIKTNPKIDTVSVASDAFANALDQRIFTMGSTRFLGVPFVGIFNKTSNQVKDFDTFLNKNNGSRNSEMLHLFVDHINAK